MIEWFVENKTFIGASFLAVFLFLIKLWGGIL